MKKSILFIVLLLPLVSMSQNFEWAISCGKGEKDDFGVISVNRSFDIFLTGKFYPPGIFGNDTLGKGYLPVMLSKLNGSGNFQWTTGIKIVGSPCSIAKTFVEASRTSDDVFLFGNICGDNYFDSIHLISTEHSIFFSRYNSAGKCLWAIEPGNNIPCVVSRVSLDSNDNILMMGWTDETLSLNGLVVGPGRFLAKFSPEGICSWVKHFNFYTGVVLQELCQMKDGGFMFAGLTTLQTVIIETDTLRSSKPFGGDLLLVKYDSNGNYLWSKVDGHTGAAGWVYSIKSDNIGYSFILGEQSRDTLILGSFILPNHNYGDQLFLAKYDKDGNVIWATNTSSRDAAISPQDMFITNDQKIYVTGGVMRYTDPDSIRFGSKYIYMLDDGMFAACYDSNGNCLGVKHAEGIPGGTERPHFHGTSIAADDIGNCVVAGQFDGTAYFDATTLTSMGMKDIFITKCTPLTGVEEIKTTPQNQLLIYANPNTGKCNITIPEEFANEKNLVLQIFDLQGKLIQQSKIEIADGKIKLDIRAQAKGMYTAVLSNDKKKYTGKIVFE
jgi:hypothetical protein